MHYGIGFWIGHISRQSKGAQAKFITRPPGLGLWRIDHRSLDNHSSEKKLLRKQDFTQVCEPYMH